MGETRDGADFFIGFVVGALVGAAAAILLAPQSGEKTRTMIHDKGIELRDRADEATLEARRRAAEMQAQAKERAEEYQARFQQAVDEGKTAASTKKEELLSQLKEESIVDEGPAEA